MPETWFPRRSSRKLPVAVRERKGAPDGAPDVAATASAYGVTTGALAMTDAGDTLLSSYHRVGGGQPSKPPIDGEFATYYPPTAASALAIAIIITIALPISIPTLIISSIFTFGSQ